MSVFSIVLLVFFVIVAVLLILIVLVQNEEGDSLGGIFAGGSSSAFGSRSGNVLTRTTSILGALFLVLSLGLALSSRIPARRGVEEAGRELLNESEGPNWVDEALDAARNEGENGDAAFELPSSGVPETPGILEAPGVLTPVLPEAVGPETAGPDGTVETASPETAQ
ncbi:MAG: preprotein translocase subunit SecG [Treponema sp.]|jgi:preprotein translocase subunit SecG|nr:preprotein translocase subunit SecG [Treponema sp.]